MILQIRIYQGEKSNEYTRKYERIALVKVYDLESNVAIYPRVVVEPELIKELGLTKANCEFRSKEWIMQDEDSLFVVDYINKYLENRDFFAFC